MVIRSLDERDAVLIEVFESVGTAENMYLIVLEISSENNHRC